MTDCMCLRWSGDWVKCKYFIYKHFCMIVQCCTRECHASFCWMWSWLGEDKQLQSSDMKRSGCSWTLSYAGRSFPRWRRLTADCRLYSGPKACDSYIQNFSMRKCVLSPFSKLLMQGNPVEYNITFFLVFICTLECIWRGTLTHGDRGVTHTHFKSADLWHLGVFLKQIRHKCIGWGLFGLFHIPMTFN